MQAGISDVDALAPAPARANGRIPDKLVAIVYRKPRPTMFGREDAGLTQALFVRRVV